jgi:hypothetical protein
VATCRPSSPACQTTSTRPPKHPPQRRPGTACGNGREAVAAFEQFGSSFDTVVFETTAFAANDTDVFAVVRYRGTQDTAQTERALST